MNSLLRLCLAFDTLVLSLVCHACSNILKVEYMVDLMDISLLLMKMIIMTHPTL